jgi:hypothetical protein
LVTLTRLIVLGGPPLPLRFGHALTRFLAELAGLVVLSLRGFAVSRRLHPLWWAATPFDATVDEALESQNGRFYLLAFSPELLQNLVNVHALPDK